MDIREQVKQADDQKIDGPIGCPEWGVQVYVRGLRGSERDWLEESMLVKSGKQRKLTMADFRAKVVMLSACTPVGEPIFRQGDEKWLTEKSGAVLDRIFTAAVAVSGLSKEDMDEIVGN